ncbi:MAG TPA: hypothetical protein VHC69_08060 [Polyangiaceae bacterium]|nr:hypothetical protein [Polyangiaceae bacterium]
MLRVSLSNYGLAKTAACVATAILWVGGCSDSHAPAARLAAGCIINSDCTAPLVCAFQRCHTACETSRDCDPGQRCVSSDRPFHVCQLDVESQCKANSDCPEGQICGIDGQCRDACNTSRDCVKGQVCVSGTCADPDELTAQGTLISAEPDSGSAASGLPCSYNSDCPSPLACKGGVCAPECRSTVDCAAGLSCDNSRCVVPLACPLGDAASDPRAGGPCLYSSQCPAPLACVHGYCSCECLGASDCAPGYACVMNRCQAVATGANAVEVGPNGGTVTSSDGKLTMNVPAGALAGSIVFSVNAATAWPAGAVGQVYEVEPSGTHFSTPATISLSYAGLNVSAATAANLFVGTAVGSSWQSLGTAVNDSRAQTVASTTTHLSVFGLVAFAAGADAGVDASGGGGSSTGGGGGPQAGNSGVAGSVNTGGRIDGAGAAGGASVGLGGFSAGAASGAGGFSTGAASGAGGFSTGAANGAGGFSAGGTSAGFPSGGFGADFSLGGFTSTGGFPSSGGGIDSTGTGGLLRDAGVAPPPT